MKNTVLLIAIALIALSGCKSSKYAELGDGVFADIQTTQGDIIVKLEHENTPITVASFVSLAEGNNPFVEDKYKKKPFYDGLIFHRVMNDFMIQGGDPLGTGSGTPGYRFINEIVDSLKHDRKGVLSMANSGGNKTNGSQFFITHKATPWLDGVHTIFGEVIKGIEVVDSIALVEVVQTKPKVDVVMKKVAIVRNGKDAKKFDAVQIMTDYFASEEEAIAEQKKKKEKFLAETQKQKELAEETASGLRIYSVSKGTGVKPKTGQNVLVNYAGWLADGTLIDTNYDDIAKTSENYARIVQGHGGKLEPAVMLYSPEARLISGFKEGLQAMDVGDKVRVFIPSHLGYGPQGSGPIPPSSDLIFDLEILAISGSE